jgi:MoaA/NifB/PqqE/SkfB family radical SAM enzyme
MFGNISVDISGGEPFMLPRFEELLKSIVGEHLHVNMTSNLFRMPELFPKMFKDRDVSLTVSVHLDSEGNIPVWLMNRLKTLRDANFHFALNFVAFAPQLRKYEKIKNIATMFEAWSHLEPYIDYNKVVTDFGDIPDKDMQYFSDNLGKTDVSGILTANERKDGTKIRTISCNVLKSYIVVAENGDVFPCLGMMFEERNRLFNIFQDEEFPEVGGTIECDIFCPCAQNYRDGLK